MFSIFGYLSLSQVIVYLAAGKPDDEWLGPVLGSALAILAAVAILGWIMAAAIYLISGGRSFHHLDAVVLSLAFLGLPALLWIENGNGILMALARLPIMNLAQVAGAAA